MPDTPELSSDTLLAAVNRWFAERSMKVVVSASDYSHAVRSAPRGRKAPSRDHHACVDLVRTDGSIVSPGYGSGLTIDEAAARARRRWQEEQEAQPKTGILDATEEYFSEPEPNVIKSSTGFAVSVLGRTGLRYTEGTRSVWIDSEVLAKPRAIAMFKESIRTWEGPEPRTVSATERDQIASNIKRAFVACGYELEVQEPFDWTTVAMRPPDERRK